MSIGICRIEKYNTAHDITGIQIHDRRERDHSNSNPDIDFQKSRNNYNLCDNAVGKNFNEYIDEQIQARYKGKKAIRKDAVRMFQVLFTADKEFFDCTKDNGRAYFEACLRWACERWGAQNIISAVVHLDEGVPHLHINIVPLTEDGRLSAKACVGDGSKALQRLQDDFFRECSSGFGLERGSRAKLDEGEKPRKHQKMGEYKRNRATIQAQRATIQAQRDIIQAAPANAPEGAPVPSMAKLLIGKENKDKLLYNADDVAAVQQLAKAAAVTAAANEKAQSENAEKEKEVAENLKKAESERKEAEEKLFKAKWRASGIVGEAKDNAEKIINAAVDEAEKREKAVSEREQACDQREQRNLELEQKLSDKEQILEIRDTEPDRYYKAVIEEKEDIIFDLAMENRGLEADINSARKSLEQAEQEAEKAKKAEEKIESENLELAEQSRKKDVQISELQKRLAETQEKLKKEENRADKNAKLYKAALEVGEYRDGDFAHKVQLCLENYKMSYIYGERGRSR